ncbi:hypothetical protein BB934_45590 (plasmid) [Microvirga ossetica]|uniref:Uncharacterized protein n=1 Tax=Microvirga ossetica TaxID=1882682 RepID=A0A1B2EZV2_9HYPH|nr:hypothetical protein [Microvirga ossetica]ANY85496.1 hypothetical protein BB934_45590 [Microvirga ossetica]
MIAKRTLIGIAGAVALVSMSAVGATAQQSQQTQTWVRDDGTTFQVTVPAPSGAGGDHCENGGADFTCTSNRHFGDPNVGTPGRRAQLKAATADTDQ